eukprot:scaffold3762_cov118-Isochrysis_galbana.AAC.2
MSPYVRGTASSSVTGSGAAWPAQPLPELADWIRIRVRPPLSAVTRTLSARPLSSKTTESPNAGTEKNVGGLAHTNSMRSTSCAAAKAWISAPPSLSATSTVAGPARSLQPSKTPGISMAVRADE